MKITVFVEDFGATGVVRNAIAIAGRLADDGHEVTLLAAKPDGVLRDTVPSGVTSEALLEEDPKGERKAVMRRAFRPFRAFVAREKPDVVFSAGNHGHMLVLPGTWLSPCRTIVRISNDLNHRGRTTDARPWRQWRRRLKFRTILTLADRVVLVSAKLLHQVTALDPKLASKAVVIPNGVDLAMIEERAAEHIPDGLFDGVPVVLAMGRLVRQKNFMTLLEAIAIARRSTNLRLVLIGKGPLRAGLLAKARDLGIADAVRLVDPVTNPFPLMKHAAVMVLPSWWEGSSNVLLEAIACGTPVIASRTAGNAAEILADDRYGLLIEPDSADEMATAILRQIGPDAVRPGERAKAYDRTIALDAYAELVAGMART
jgi:glycosyltransferase involved in cell wall biosynthesis